MPSGATFISLNTFKSPALLPRTARLAVCLHSANATHSKLCEAGTALPRKESARMAKQSYLLNLGGCDVGVVALHLFLCVLVVVYIAVVVFREPMAAAVRAVAGLAPVAEQSYFPGALETDLMVGLFLLRETGKLKFVHFLADGLDMLYFSALSHTVRVAGRAHEASGCRSEEVVALYAQLVTHFIDIDYTITNYHEVPIIPRHIPPNAHPTRKELQTIHKAIIVHAQIRKSWLTKIETRLLLLILLNSSTLLSWYANINGSTIIIIPA